jgi:hypothetical protein
VTETISRRKAKKPGGTHKLVHLFFFGGFGAFGLGVPTLWSVAAARLASATLGLTILTCEKIEGAGRSYKPGGEVSFQAKKECDNATTCTNTGWE